MGCNPQALKQPLMLSGIVKESIVDGRGIRYVLFTQGCPHHCPGCHNPQTHPFQGGEPADMEKILTELKEDPLLKGVTFSGGEPFCQPAPLAALAEKIHAMGLDVTVYTGYTLEQLWSMDQPQIQALLDQTDLLVDGPFLQEQRDLTLRFRGSRNQRLIDMNQTRSQGRIVLEPEEEF